MVLEPNGDPLHDKEVDFLKKLVASEQSHSQWPKQGLNILCLIVLTIFSFLRGGKSEIGFEKCSGADWAAVAIFLSIMAVLVFVATKMAGSEQKLKQKFGNVNLVDSDLKFDGVVLRKILLLGFAGGFVAGAFGLGGGSIYNPMLLSMGVPPKVSSATGMYLVGFSTISTSFIFIIMGNLKVDYSVWAALWSTLGAMLGQYLAKRYMKKSGRQSIIVLMLTIILGVAVIGVPFFGGLDLAKKLD